MKTTFTLSKQQKSMQSAKARSPFTDIINEKYWHSWCRLCASQNTDNATKISFETGRKLPLYQNFIPSRTIEKYFEIHIAPDDMYPTTICVECHTFTQSIIQFTERVAKVQEIYDALICEERFETRDNIAQALAKLELLKAKPDNLEYRVSPAVVKGEPGESVDGKEDRTFINDAETECIVEAANDNRHIDENEEDPFAKIDDVKSKVRVYKRRRCKLREVRVKQQRKDQNTKENLNCKKCDESFPSFALYCNHMRNEHAVKEKSKNWDCPKCSRVVYSSLHLERHFQTHTVPCPKCEKCFSTDNQLMAHIKFQHTNEKPFLCEECGADFRSSSNLNSHIQTHNDKCLYECEVCEKKLKSRQTLKRHMETHGNQEFICLQCGLKLSSSVTLNRHLLVHSDKMQHKCDYCGRAFKRAKTLKNHLILHTGLKLYDCDFCERTFTNGSNCRTHKKKMHPTELAAWEAAGAKTVTKNIPKLEILKTLTKTSDNLLPVVTKQSGCFAFSTKSKSCKTLHYNTIKHPEVQRENSSNLLNRLKKDNNQMDVDVFEKDNPKCSDMIANSNNKML